MPYIEPGLRKEFDRFEQQPPTRGADLNYVICRLLSRFVSFQGINYRTIEQVTTAMQGALNEFNRLVAWPYEDEKRKLNGDVWNEIVR